MPLAAIAGVAIAGGIMGSSAASNAASTQSNAAKYAADLQYQASQQALDFQKSQFAQEQANMLPWLQSGAGALSNLDYLLGITPATGGGYSASSMPTSLALPSSSPQSPGGLGGLVNQVRPVSPAASTTASAPTINSLSATPNTSLGSFGSLMKPFGEQFQAPTAITEQNDPGFQARLKLGTDALERSAAARGGVLTGGTAKALDTYAQDYASNEYGNVYNRAYNDWATKYNVYNQNQTNQYNRLANLAGVGQQTASQMGLMGQNASNNVTSNLMNTAAGMGQQYNNAAAATASGYIGGANAWGNAMNSGVGNFLTLLKMAQG